MAVDVDMAENYELSSVEIPNNPAGADRLLHVSFNQDGGCFAAGTTSGFRVYNCDRFFEMARRDLVEFWRSHTGGGGVGAVEMLFRTNCFALIGGGGDPNARKVFMWDDSLRRCTGVLSVLGGGSHLRGVRVLRDCVAVVNESSVAVFSFADLRLRRRYETSPNLRGLCALTPLGSRVLACPGPRQGQVRVERLHLTGNERRTVFIDAHPDSCLTSLALSQDGRLVATSGVSGANVRVFDAGDGKLLQEASLADASEQVHGLAFSNDARFLAASGDGGAVQVFGLRADEQDAVAPSRFRTGDGERCVVAFGAQRNTVVVVTMGGSFYRCRFDPEHGGEMQLLERHNFMSSSN
jgi:WD repeat-containing protein 45